MGERRGAYMVCWEALMERDYWEDQGIFMGG
jgi:hypothetical protein